VTRIVDGSVLRSGEEMAVALAMIRSSMKVKKMRLLVHLRRVPRAGEQRALPPLANAHHMYDVAGSTTSLHVISYM